MYLIHHGILGQKWGVRRYQNPDGTLTDAGRKRYDKMSAKALHRELKKEVRNKRTELHGLSNRWARSNTIGKESEKVYKTAVSNEEKYEQTTEYKKWLSKWNDLDKKLINGQIDVEQYDELEVKLYDERPKRNFNTQRFCKIYSKDGIKYADDYLNKGGKDLSIAYLKDLGFSKDVSEQFVDKLIKKGFTLGDV